MQHYKSLCSGRSWLRHLSGVCIFFDLHEYFTCTECLKAVLLSVLAISSLSSFVYSEFAVFGKKVGLGINVFALVFWAAVAPLGVMGVWTLMAESRVYLILGILAVAVMKKVRDRRKAVLA